MQSKRTTEESTDRGVSPVIGVILMVAITVILAAVIAAFVLDIGPGDPNPNAAVSVDESGEEITLDSTDGNTDGVAVFYDNDSVGAVLTVSGESTSIHDEGEARSFSGGPDDLSDLIGEDDDDFGDEVNAQNIEEEWDF